MNKKPLYWFLVGGLMAYPIEGLWRIPSNGGWVSISMFPVYGLCLLCVGILNQFRWFYERPVSMQSVIGGIVFVVVEYFAGCILNLGLKLDIWDYSHLPLNVHGQISILFAFLWWWIMPFAIWLEDRVSWIYNKATNQKEVTWNYTLRQIYKDLFIGR